MTKRKTSSALFPDTQQSLASSLQRKTCAGEGGMCPRPPVWSPFTHGPTWYCHMHAGWPEPPPDPEPRVYTAQEIADAKAFVANFAREGRPLFALPGREWAHVLRFREESGESLSPLQRSMWRAAIASEQEHDEELAAERNAIRNESAPL